MSRYNKEHLEILIATMDRSDFGFLEKMFASPVADIEYHILIVNQSDSYTLSSTYDHIKVINTATNGLSRSRNTAIDNSSKPLLWLLDDDCKVLPTAARDILKAHNTHEDAILTFQTQCLEDGTGFWDYPMQSTLLTSKSSKNALSPELTFKKADLDRVGLRFDERFGLGAQFEDSENYIFLTTALNHHLNIRFVPDFIVRHKSTTSSDEASSDRLIYARGALAAREGSFISTCLNYKYTFFLWRTGRVTGIKALRQKHSVFKKGIDDYLQTVGN